MSRTRVRGVRGGDPETPGRDLRVTSADVGSVASTHPRTASARAYRGTPVSGGSNGPAPAGALPAAEQRERFGWRGARVAEPVGRARVELRHLPHCQGEVVFAEQEAQVPGQHVQPLVALVNLLLGCAGRHRDKVLTKMPAAEASWANVAPLR